MGSIESCSKSPEVEKPSCYVANFHRQELVKKIEALKEKHRERRDGLKPATDDTLLRVNIEILR